MSNYQGYYFLRSKLITKKDYSLCFVAVTFQSRNREYDIQKELYILHLVGSHLYWRDLTRYSSKYSESS